MAGADEVRLLKTAPLFRIAAQFGAHAAGAPSWQVDALTKFSEKRAADPQGRGRQFLTSRLEKLAGTRLAGFIFSRQEAVGKWSAATYKLERTGGDEHREHREHGAGGPPMTPMNDPYAPYAFSAPSER